MAQNSCYCIPIRTASRKVSTLYNDALKPIDINITQFSMLRKINRARKLTITELAKLMDLDRTTTSRGIKVLNKRGLLNISPGKDQRETTISLSENGRKVLEEGNVYWAKAQGELVSKLGGEEQLATLLDLLKQL